jgi:uncharacterized protein YggU (UPF0235/DUF167 family)
MAGAGLPWVALDAGVRLSVRLTPKSARDGLDGLETLSDGRVVLKARVRAVPEDGKANEALRRVIAKSVGVSTSAVEIAGGATSRLKTLAIAGDPAALDSRLRMLIGL